AGWRAQAGGARPGPRGGCTGSAGAARRGLAEGARAGRVARTRPAAPGGAGGRAAAAAAVIRCGPLPGWGASERMELDDLLRGEGLDAEGVEDALAWARRRAAELVRGIDGDPELGPLLGLAVDGHTVPHARVPTPAPAEVRAEVVAVEPAPPAEVTQPVEVAPPVDDETQPVEVAPPDEPAPPVEVTPPAEVAAPDE